MSDEQTIHEILARYQSNLNHLAIIRAQYPDPHEFDRDVLTALASLVDREAIAEAIAIVAETTKAKRALAVFASVLQKRLEEGGQS